MAKSNFVKKAQKDIYVKGARVEYISKKGKREGQTLSKTDKTIPFDENDKILIKKGEGYYWWAFKNSPKNYSKTRPRNSQLTQSAYLSTLYGIVESIGDFSTDNAEAFSEFVEDIKNQVEELKEQTEESLENMPESLKYSPTGELLQERIDLLENAYSELDGLDCEYEEQENEDVAQEIADEEGITLEEVTEDAVIDKKAEAESLWVDEKMDELRCIEFE